MKLQYIKLKQGDQVVNHSIADSMHVWGSNSNFRLRQTSQKGLLA